MRFTTRLPEPRVLLALFLAASAIWTFLEIDAHFVAGRPNAIDTRILLAFRTESDPTDPLGPQWVEGAARDITALGSLGVLSLVVAGTVTYLFLARQPLKAWTLLAAMLGGIAASTMLKSIFGRPRPDLPLHQVDVYSSSFPSGHAVMAAVTYLTLGAMFARGLRTHVLKAYVMLVALALTLLVGVSRVYLGVHWPSDVVGGWSLGAAWALLCWAAAEWFGKPEDR
jgi:undecaprenyl-diphosphatase